MTAPARFSQAPAISSPAGAPAAVPPEALPVTNEVFRYVLAVAARRFGVQVHAFCVLSNHFHLLVTDPQARLPAFEQYLDSLVARALNASLGRWESFWAPSSYSAVALSTPRPSSRRPPTFLANPVAAGWSRTDATGRALVASGANRLRSNGGRRPTVFFRPEGGMPETAELELFTPPGFDSPADFRDRLAQALAVLEEQAQRNLSAKGQAFLGQRRCWPRSPPAAPHRRAQAQAQPQGGRPGQVEAGGGAVAPGRVPRCLPQGLAGAAGRPPRRPLPGRYLLAQGRLRRPLRRGWVTRRSSIGVQRLMVLLEPFGPNGLFSTISGIEARPGAARLDHSGAR